MSIVDLSPEGRLDLRFPAGLFLRGVRAGADLGGAGRALASRFERRGTAGLVPLHGAAAPLIISGLPPARGCAAGRAAPGGRKK